MSVTVWMTGLSGSGKSTLANSLLVGLFAQGVPCEVLDGDTLRKDVCADLDFSRHGRLENVKRVARLCRDANDRGLVAIAALISPFADDRAEARRIIGEGRFVEVYLSTSLEVCEQRDIKGLYARARSGEIVQFTGVSDPYEAPICADLVINTENSSIAQCLSQLRHTVSRRLQTRGLGM